MVGLVDAVRLDQATVALGGRAVLDRVSLAIFDDEMVAVLGPNGSGKTTLMRAILGLVPLREGTLQVLGGPVRRGSRQIGYLPQSRLAGPAMRLSGRDLLASAVKGDRWGLPWPSRERRRELDGALELVGATALAARPLGELSGGERQRLHIALALLGRPKLLLLDEPLVNLDPRYQQEVVALVREVQRELGIAVLFSAHEINPLLGAIDRVLYLGSGQAAIGPVEEVITGPVLSRLYGTQIEVVPLGGRYFVMSGSHDLEGAAHLHDHGHRHHAH